MARCNTAYIIFVLNSRGWCSALACDDDDGGGGGGGEKEDDNISGSSSSDTTAVVIINALPRSSAASFVKIYRG